MSENQDKVASEKRDEPLSGPLARPERYRDNNAPSPFWPSFAEKLIAALVDGNPLETPDGKTDRDTRSRRINNALEALFEKPISAGVDGVYDLPEAYNAFVNPTQAGLRVLDDNSVVLGRRTTVTDHLHETAWDEAYEVRGVRTIIKKALAHKVAQVSESTLRARAKDQDYLVYFIDVQSGDTRAEEADMLRDLKLIGEVLSRWSIGLSADPLRLAMASSWGECGTDDHLPGVNPPNF